jgi:hypothetical protein
MFQHTAGAREHRHVEAVSHLRPCGRYRWLDGDSWPAGHCRSGSLAGEESVQQGMLPHSTEMLKLNAVRKVAKLGIVRNTESIPTLPETQGVVRDQS